MSIAPTPTTIQFVNGGFSFNGSATVIAPTDINPFSAMSLPAFKQAIRFLADNLASFPRAVLKDGAKPEDTQAHPLQKLLNRRPNGYQNSFVLWRTWFSHAAAGGNGYLRVERAGGAGRAIALHTLLPHDVCPFRFDLNGTIGQYFYIRSSRAVYSGDDVLHLQSLGYDGVAGTDPVAQHEPTFQHGATLSKYQTRFLQSGSFIRGAVEFPGAMTTAQLDEMAAYMRRFFWGHDAEKDVLLLAHGAKMNNATISPQQSMIVEQGAMLTKQIAQITGVPPEYLFERSESKYNPATIEQAGQAVVRYTLRPWIEQADDELTMKLLTAAEQDAGYAVRINPDALMRGDTAAVNQSAISTKNAGLRTPNESRQLIGLPRIDNTDADTLQTLGTTEPKTPPAT